jgi:hypothetical protein
MENRLDTQELTQQAKEKMPYRSPQLFVYGNVREITQNVGNTGATDGGIAPMQKTQP